MTIHRLNCMKAVRQGSVSISLSPAARSCAGSRPASGVVGYRILLVATGRAPWPITESDWFPGYCAADQLPNADSEFILLL
jgi:hypothetical protein